MLVNLMHLTDKKFIGLEGRNADELTKIDNRVCYGIIYTSSSSSVLTSLSHAGEVLDAFHIIIIKQTLLLRFPKSHTLQLKYSGAFPFLELNEGGFSSWNFLLSWEEVEWLADLSLAVRPISFAQQRLPLFIVKLVRERVAQMTN